MRHRTSVCSFVFALTACASSPPPSAVAPPPPPVTADAGSPAPPAAPVADAGPEDAAPTASPAPPAEPVVVRWRFARSGRGTRATVTVEQRGASPQTHDFGAQPGGCRVTVMDAPVAGNLGGVECSVRGVGTAFSVWAEPGVVRITSGPIPHRAGAPRPADVTLTRVGDGPVPLAE